MSDYIRPKKYEEEEQRAALREINQHMRDGLNQWADIALQAEVKQWAYHMDYYPRDLMNVAYLFQHVASNIGIKSGNIDEKKAVEFGTRLRQLIIDMTGHDPHGILRDLTVEQVKNEE